MNKTELIEMLKRGIESAKEVMYQKDFGCSVAISVSEAADLLRELDEKKSPICKCGNKKVLQYACEQCDY